MERVLALQNMMAGAVELQNFGDSTISNYCSSQSVARCSSISNQCQGPLPLTEAGGEW